MNSRQQTLLNLVIDSHIATAEPIGSKFLVEKSGLEWSEATVRNDLHELEEEGYLSHPHTSAGRVPTEKGYKFYIANLNLEAARASKKETQELEKAGRMQADQETVKKYLAKKLVELSDATIVIAFSPREVYYTGLANIFNKPELLDMKAAASITEAVESCEDCLADFYQSVSSEVEFFIGADNPFGDELSALSFRFGDNSLVMMLGPQRMDYEKNYRLMKKLKEII